MSARWCRTRTSCFRRSAGDCCRAVPKTSEPACGNRMLVVGAEAEAAGLVDGKLETSAQCQDLLDQAGCPEGSQHLGGCVRAKPDRCVLCSRHQTLAAMTACLTSAVALACRCPSRWGRSTSTTSMWCAHHSLSQLWLFAVPLDDGQRTEQSAETAGVTLNSPTLSRSISAISCGRPTLSLHANKAPSPKPSSCQDVCLAQKHAAPARQLAKYLAGTAAGTAAAATARAPLNAARSGAGATFMSVCWRCMYDSCTCF